VIEDPASRHLALRAEPGLAELNRAGVLDAADVHVATRVGALAEEDSADVRLAVALAVRAARLGAVCVDLLELPSPAELAEDPELTLTWPSRESWLEAVRRSTLTARGVLRLEGSLLYLDRHWREEKQVCDDLQTRLRLRPPEIEETPLRAALVRMFPPGWEEQRDATDRATRQWTTVLTGGPGTGKTASVARLLAVLSEQFEASLGRPPRIALAAPTGKAAARLQESVVRERDSAQMPPQDAARLVGIGASTVHRLLGWRPDNSTRFRHHRANPLPYDVVVVDEVSMVSLTQMTRLLEAVRPTTRLVLVGDPDQLASVEAGAVLADLVVGFEGRADSPVVRLETTHRTAADEGGRALDALARAMRESDIDETLALLGSTNDAVRLVDPADRVATDAVRDGVVGRAVAIADAAQDSETEVATSLLEEHRLLCAHREGPYGVAGWNRQVVHHLAESAGVAHLDEWYAGRPVLITANDRGLGLSNGDLGVTVRADDGRLRVMVRLDGELKPFAPTRLTGVETVYAMTVHKSQGSEARAVTVVLPPEESPLLTRELLYTAVTRARQSVTIIGTQDAVRAAVSRKVQRASGLARRLQAARP
jgi:exodeoxyribonuclease V alpha subunit